MIPEHKRTILLGRRLTVSLGGPLDQRHLDQLAANLGLTMSGTPDAPVGTDLGYRSYEPQPGILTLARIVLTRSGDHEWTLTLDTSPSLAIIATWQSLVDIGARAAELTITSRWIAPPVHRGHSPEQLHTDITAAQDDIDLSLDTEQPTPVESPPEVEIDASLYEIDPTPLLFTDRTAPEMTDYKERPSAAPHPLNEPDTDTFRPWSLDFYDPPTDSFAPVTADTAPPPPVHTPEMDDRDLVELVGRIRNLVWGWRAADLHRLAGAAGFYSVEGNHPHRVTYTNRHIAGNCYANIDDAERIESVDIPVANLPDTEDGQTRLRETFTRMAAALTRTYGNPTDTPEPHTHMVWIGAENTLTLRYSPPQIRAVFQRNPGITMICGEAEHTRRDRTNDWPL